MCTYRSLISLACTTVFIFFMQNFGIFRIQWKLVLLYFIINFVFTLFLFALWNDIFSSIFFLCYQLKILLNWICTINDTICKLIYPFILKALFKKRTVAVFNKNALQHFIVLYCSFYIWMFKFYFHPIFLCKQIVKATFFKIFIFIHLHIA